jgi:HEAT repeat protein
MELQALINGLDSLHDLDQAVARLIAYGPGAIPALERFLFEGKPSVVWEPRRAAVEVLGALGAKDVLIRYLLWEKNIPDAATRMAEELIEDAAARELAAFRTADVLETLRKLAQGRLRPGVVEALGRFAPLDEMPYFIRALEDDFSHAAAEDALRTLGAQAETALVTSSLGAYPSQEDERPSSKRRRARSLELLGGLGPSAESWTRLKSLLQDSDPEISLAAAKIAAKMGNPADRAASANRLREILPSAAWFLRDEIRNCLTNLQGARP